MPWSLLAGGGLVAALAAAWALWERGRRHKAEAQRDGARMAAELYQQRLAQAEADKADAIRRREEVIRVLRAEVERQDAALRPIAGDVFDRLERLLAEGSPSPAPASTGVPPRTAT